MSTNKAKKQIDSFELKPSEVYAALKLMARTKLSTFVWGPPGIAKSSIIKQLAKDLGYQFIDIRLSQMDPTDLRGIPYPTEELIDGVMTKGMRWSAPLVLPRDPAAKAIILLDEFNAAPPSVQAGAYQLVLDRQLGEYKVPDGCMIVAAGNRETDKGITFRMPTPIANRFTHLNMKADFDDWQIWALENNVDQNVVGYLTAFKDKLFNFDPTSATRGFQTPRSWSFVSDIVKAANDIPEIVLYAMVTGAIGDDGVAFMEHRKHASKLPDPRDVLAGKVKTLPDAKSEVALCYALTTSLCYQLKEDHEKVKNDPTLDAKQKEKQMDDWMAKADHFLGFMMENFQPEVTIMGAKTALSVFKLTFNIKKMPQFDIFSKKFKSLILTN